MVTKEAPGTPFGPGTDSLLACVGPRVTEVSFCNTQSGTATVLGTVPAPVGEFAAAYSLGASTPHKRVRALFLVLAREVLVVYSVVLVVHLGSLGFLVQETTVQGTGPQLC